MRNPKTINEPFVCGKCGENIPPHPGGSCRNHCPFCLWSKHVDKETPGDRESDCGGMMKPLRVEYSSDKGEVLITECLICGKIHKNKIAPDDSREKLENLAKNQQ